MESSEYSVQGVRLLSYQYNLKFQLFCQRKNKILRSAGRCNHPVGESLFQFSFGCTCRLRAREVFLQSGRAADRHGAANPDELPGAGIKNLLILEIKNFLANFHGTPFCSMNACHFHVIYYIHPAKGTS